MSVNSQHYGKVQLASESSYSEASTSFATADIIEVEEITVDFGGTRHERNPRRDGPYELAPNQGSYHGGSVTLKGVLGALSSTAPTTNPTPHPYSKLAYGVLGGSVQSGFAAAAAASGGTDGNIKADGGTAASTWKAGSAVGVANAGGSIMVGWILSVTDNAPSDHDLALILPMAAAPAAGGALYGSDVSYLARPGLNPGPSFRLLFQPMHAENRMIAHGMRVEKLSFELTPDMELKYEALLKVDRWTLSTGSDLSAYTFQYPRLPVAIGRYGSRMVYGDGGGSAVDFDVQSMKVSMEAKYAKALSMNPDNGVLDLRCVHRQVRISATRELLDTFIAQNLLVDLGDALQFDLGTSAGRMFSMLVPNPVTVDRDSPSAEEERYVQTFTFGCGQYTADGSADAAGSPFRIAFL